MKRIICWILCFALTPVTVFASENRRHWAYDELTQAVQAGILKGTLTGDLEPDRFITRAELVTMALRVKKETIQAAAESFSDVSSDAWYGAAVAYAAGKGYVTGAGGNWFLPDEPITRQDAAVILCRIFEIDITAGLELSSFTDSMQIADYALGSIAALTTRGILNGTDDRAAKPLASLTRAEAVVLLTRLEAYRSAAKDVTFLRGYPHIAASSFANGFNIILKTNMPCTVYYSMTDASRAGGSVVPSASQITTPLAAITDTSRETICFIPADDSLTYNLFFSAKTASAVSRTAWISQVRPHPYTKGDGSARNPYCITNEQQLSDIRYQSDKCYKLENDIVLSSAWKPLGSDDMPFTGVFDGGGHTISALTISERTNDVGLFSHIGTQGVVKNLYVAADTVTGTNNVGILCGQNYGTIESCQTTGTVSATNNTAGGITGTNHGDISCCISAAQRVEAYLYAGGITGYNSGVIDQCAAYAHTVSANAYACGIAAVNTNGTVKNCLAGEMNVLTNIVRNSSRITANRESGKTENNYSYNRMNAELDDGYQSANAKNGADITWKQLTDLEFYQKNMQWDTARWSQSNDCSFIAPRLAALPIPVIEAGTTVYAPKRVATQAELSAIDSARDLHYMLTADITLSHQWTPIAGENPLLQDNANGFSGTLNGNGHTIRGLRIEKDNQRQLYGLFGMITSGAVFSLTAEGGLSATGGYAGLIAAVNYGHIESCAVRGSISGTTDGSLYAGGAVGANYGQIDDCDAQTDINILGINITAGGIAAYQENYINNCSYQGQIRILPKASSPPQDTAHTQTTAAAGGITGYCADGFVYHTYANADIRLSSDVSYAGGSVGMLDHGELYKSCAKGTVTINSKGENAYAGGLCGLSGSGLVMNSFSVSEISAEADTSYAGGLVGYNISASIQDNYAANSIVQHSTDDGYAAGICAADENGFISSNVAVNPTIACDGHGARICAAAPDDVVSGNYAYDGMKINNEKRTDSSPSDGEPVSYQTITSRAFYLLPAAENGPLGWESEVYGGSAIWEWKPRSNPTYPFPLLCGVKKQETFWIKDYR